MASEERRVPRVTADLLKVIYCPSSSVLKSPVQVLNTTQLKEQYILPGQCGGQC